VACRCPNSRMLSGLLLKVGDRYGFQIRQIPAEWTWKRSVLTRVIHVSATRSKWSQNSDENTMGWAKSNLASEVAACPRLGSHAGYEAQHIRTGVFIDHDKDHTASGRIGMVPEHRVVRYINLKVRCFTMPYYLSGKGVAGLIAWPVVSNVNWSAGPQQDTVGCAGCFKLIIHSANGVPLSWAGTGLACKPRAKIKAPTYMGFPGLSGGRRWPSSHTFPTKLGGPVAHVTPLFAIC
jgi:hypothetical protein